MDAPRFILLPTMVILAFAKLSSVPDSLWTSRIILERHLSIMLQVAVTWVSQTSFFPLVHPLLSWMGKDALPYIVPARANTQLLCAPCPTQ